MPFFSEFAGPGRVWTEFGTKIFFFSFSAYVIPFWLKIMPERGFLIFWIFLLFNSEFSSGVEYERNSRLNFFCLFLSLSHPVLATNNAGKSFLVFWIFLLFFRNFLTWVKCEQNSGLKFIFLFLGLAQPVLYRSKAGINSFDFFKFLCYFFKKNF